MPDTLPDLSSLVSLPDAVFLVDRDSRVLWCNPAASRLEVMRSGDRHAGLRGLLAAGCAWDDVLGALDREGAWEGDLVLRAPGGARALEARAGVVGGQQAAALFVVRDITAARDHVHHLERRLATLATVFETSPVAQAVAAADTGVCLFVNEAWAKESGRSVEDMLGRTPAEWGTVDRETSGRLLATLRAEGRLDQVGVESRDGWGATRHGVLSSVVVDSPLGPLAVSAWQDVTNLKRAEEALRETNARYERVVSAVPSIIWSAEIDEHLEFRNVYISPVAERVMGLEPGTLNHDLRRFILAMHPDDLDEAMTTLIEGAMTPGRTRSHTYRLVRADGEIRWLRTVGSSFINSRGAHEVFGVTEDLTEQRQAEAAAREREEAFARVFHQFPLPTTLVDCATATYTDVNDAFCDATGLAREQVLGRTEREFGLRVLSDRRALMRELGSSGRVDAVDFSVALPDGRERHGLVWVRVVNARGRPHYLTNFQDLTDRRRAQEEHDRLSDQLRQAQKLESVGRLAGGVAHDFNNLLTVILGNVEVALADLSPALGVSAPLEQIRKAGESAASLTRQLLAFSRRQVIEPRDLDIDVLVHDLQRMLVRLLGEDIALDVTPSGAGAVVRADPGQIEQILLNLAVNARDAMPTGGRLSIRVRRAVTDESFVRRHPAARMGSFVELAVRDTGTGMTDDVRQHLFEPFFTTKPVGQGTGLGLSMVYGAVEQNGGFILVDSAVGEGSTFRVFLPHVAPGARAGAPAATAGIAPTGTETILVVEDAPAVRDLARRALQRLGYRVLACADGPTARRAAADAGMPIQLLVTDVVMPGMSGDELARDLLATFPDLRVILTSGYAQHLRRDLPGVHHSRFLPKPYTPTALAQAVRQVLDAS